MILFREEKKNKNKFKNKKLEKCANPLDNKTEVSELKVSQIKKCGWTITVKDNPQLSEPQGPGSYYVIGLEVLWTQDDRNELQVRKSLHKGTEKKWLKN